MASEEEYILFAEGSIRTVFHLKKHGTGFHHFQRVPLSGREMDPVFILFRVDDGLSGQLFLVVIEQYPDDSAEHNLGFCCMLVPVYR